MESQVSEPKAPTSSGSAVADVMRPAVTSVETGSHLAAAAYLMAHANQSALVVVDLAQRPVAIITEADLLRAVAHGADTGEALISDWMDCHPQIVRPETTVTEAAQLMLDASKLHLPVVSNGQVVGIVAVSDVIHALVGAVRLSSVIVFVSDLNRSVSFYQPLLRYAVTVADPEAALLAGPDGSQLYLRQVPGGAPQRNDGIGVQWAAWSAASAEDLDRCTDLLKVRGAFVRRDTSDGITRVEGRDPDGIAVLITHPGPERVPRHLIPSRVRTA
jgi:CBS domain-containing protein